VLHLHRLDNYDGPAGSDDFAGDGDDCHDNPDDRRDDCQLVQLVALNMDRA
jgi:hypothetical protein